MWYTVYLCIPPKGPLHTITILGDFTSGWKVPGTVPDFYSNHIVILRNVVRTHSISQCQRCLFGVVKITVHIAEILSLKPAVILKPGGPLVERSSSLTATGLAPEVRGSQDRNGRGFSIFSLGAQLPRFVENTHTLW